MFARVLPLSSASLSGWLMRKVCTFYLEPICHCHWNSFFMISNPTDSLIVQQIRVKIALNVVKASKLIQMKLMTWRSKLGLGAFRKFSAFVLTSIWLPQTKACHWRRNSWKNFYLTSRIKCNHWKELTRLVQNDLGTILIGWIVAEIFDLENTPKLLTGPKQHLFYIFLRNSICHNSAGISPIDLFHGHFESVFRALFSCGIYIVNKQDNKNMFLNNYDFMVKSLYA